MAHIHAHVFPHDHQVLTFSQIEDIVDRRIAYHNFFRNIDDVLNQLNLGTRVYEEMKKSTPSIVNTYLNNNLFSLVNSQLDMLMPKYIYNHPTMQTTMSFLIENLKKEADIATRETIGKIVKEGQYQFITDEFKRDVLAQNRLMLQEAQHQLVMKDQKLSDTLRRIDDLERKLGNTQTGLFLAFGLAAIGTGTVLLRK